MTHEVGLSTEEHMLFEEMLAERQIRKTLLRYLRGADRKDWELVASAFHPDAYDDHGPHKGDAAGLIEWAKQRHATMDQSMHFVGNMLIEVDGDTAVAETYCITYQHLHTGNNDFSTGKPIYRRSVIGLRYVDRFEKRGDEWKIAHRVCVFEWAKEDLGNLNFDAKFVVAKRSRDDMIYHIANARPPQD